MKTLFDNTKKEFPVTLHVNTNVGRINFYTGTGNKYEAVLLLKGQNPEVTHCDIHHAKIYNN